MATDQSMDVNDLSKLLFQCLSTSDPNFDSDSYLNEFETRKTSPKKVNFVHKDVCKFFHIFVKYTNHCKDDFVAIAFEETATENLDNGKFMTALEGYSRCVATAESKDLLALAYGNRSVCFLKLKMPRKCLEVQLGYNFQGNILISLFAGHGKSTCQRLHRRTKGRNH